MKLTVERRLTPVEIAEAFCELDDEQQAQFFIEAARIAEGWPANPRVMQWYSIGRHLATCSCSTWEAREMVRVIGEAATSPSGDR
jgi:hypothetical protein